jgi:hypothetical protein
VIICVRNLCHIKSLGPFKGSVSTLATHLTEITSFCLSSLSDLLSLRSKELRLNALLFCVEIVNLPLWILPSVLVLCITLYVDKCSQLLVVCLMSSYGDHPGCVLLVVGWCRRVQCVCSFLHERTHLKQKKKFGTYYHRNEEVRYNFKHSDEHFSKKTCPFYKL